MLLRNCTITFNKPVFYAGEVITGTVTLKMEKNKTCKALSLKMVGDGKCSFRESHGHGKNRKTKIYTGHQVYFKTFKDLLANQEKYNDSKLEAGDYSFNFAYALPNNLPSSIEEDFGRMRYTAVVTLERPFKADLCYKEAFTVLNHLDVKMYPDRCIPVLRNIERSFQTFFAQRGMLNVNVKIPFSGWVSGQYIPVDCHLVNKSKVNVKCIKIYLIKNMTYNASSPCARLKYSHKVIRKYVFGKVGRGQQSNSDFSIHVPSTPSSSLTYQSIINVEYELKFRVVFSGMHRDLTFSLPITIGTIPFVPNVQSIDEPQASSSSSSNFEHTAPPPSYEEAMSSKRMEEEHEDWDHSNEYTPKYPVYNFEKTEKLTN